MTALARPTRTQIHDAILWLEWYHTGGSHRGGVDRTDHFKQVLGDRTHHVITEAVKAWHRRNTLTSIGSVMRREVDDGATVTVEGDLFFTIEHTDHGSSPWASALIADQQVCADVEVMFFPHIYAANKALITDGQSVRVTGRVKHAPWACLIATEVLQADLVLDGAS